MWEGHEQGAPVGTELPEPDLPCRQQELGWGRVQGLPLEQQIAAACSERYLKGHSRAFQPHL